LAEKLAASKQYNEAQIAQIIGLAQIKEDAANAALDADKITAESEFDLNMTKQTEATKTALVEAKALFDQDLLSTEEYYKKKRDIEKADLDAQVIMLEKQKRLTTIRVELRILEEEDENKKVIMRANLADALAKIDGEIVKAKEEYARADAKIDADKYKADEKNQAKIDAMIKNAQKLKDSLVGGVAGASLGDAQSAELTAYDEETADLMEAMLDREAKFDEAKELSDLRQAARDALVTQQKKAMYDLQLNQAQTFASGMADLTEQMYNAGILSGKKGFKVMQAFAVAEATISAIKAAQNAFEEGSKINVYVGAAMAALAMAQGMMRVSKIQAQKPPSYAEGGEIQGYSPTTTSDNIDIRATAGEYMQPVSAVRKYGVRVMNAIRNLSLPKEALTNLIQGTSLGLATPIPSFALAGGGSVASSSSSGGGSTNKILSSLTNQ